MPQNTIRVTCDLLEEPELSDKEWDSIIRLIENHLRECPEREPRAINILEIESKFHWNPYDPRVARGIWIFLLNFRYENDVEFVY